MIYIAAVALFVVSNVGSFLIGLVGRRELRLYRTATRRGPETLDFTRRRVGA